MKLKNTQITGINELVIDGRTQKIRWVKFDESWWYRTDFESKGPTNQAILISIKVYQKSRIYRFYKGSLSYEVIIDGEHTEKILQEYEKDPVVVMTHDMFVNLMKTYDLNQRKYKTWISGNTFNVVVKRR